MRKNLIIGSGGQDGRYLTELLEGRGEQVIGLTKGEVAVDGEKFHASVLEAADMRSVIGDHRPDSVYYLAAFHHAADEDGSGSVETLRKSMDVHLYGLVNVLEALAGECPDARLFYAASSHIFGDAGAQPITEETPIAPLCWYGISKAAGVAACRKYRAERALYCSVGMLFNHESPRRPSHFLTRRIVSTALDIAGGSDAALELWNPGARVDWGFAGDYVRAMAAILSLDEADDFIIASGKTHTVGEFSALVFRAVGLDWQDHLSINAERLVKAARKEGLVGDASKLRAATDWQPEVDFEGLVQMMVEAEQHRRDSA